MNTAGGWPPLENHPPDVLLRFPVRLRQEEQPPSEDRPQIVAVLLHPFVGHERPILVELEPLGCLDRLPLRPEDQPLPVTD